MLSVVDTCACTYEATTSLLLLPCLHVRPMRWPMYRCCLQRPTTCPLPPLLTPTTTPFFPSTHPHPPPTRPGYPPFYSDDPLTTCRKIVNWRMFLKFPDEIALSPAARDLIQRLMCDVDDRLGTQGVQVGGWVAGGGGGRVETGAGLGTQGVQVVCLVTGEAKQGAAEAVHP
jgi:hypothetical protein